MTGITRRPTLNKSVASSRSWLISFVPFNPDRLCDSLTQYSPRKFIHNMARGGFTSTRSRGFRGGGSFRSRGGGYRGRARGRGGSNTPAAVPARDEEGNKLAERFEQVRLSDEVDERIGFPKIREGPRRDGWMINMHPVRAVSRGEPTWKCLPYALR